MKNLEKLKTLLKDGTVDALFLTSAVNRFYAAEYSIAEGAALICRDASYYFTDSRYIEAAQNNIPNFTVLMTDAAHPYSDRLNDAIAENGVKTIGFEEDYLTYGEFMRYQLSLHAELKPFQKSISSFRAVKDPWELDRMRKAQQITDLTFQDMCKLIQPGKTEKELAAELVYSLSRHGADGLAFEPIVVTGTKTSMPHGVPGDNVVREGDFVTMDFGAAYQGYCSDMTRTVAVGSVSEEMDKVYHVVLQAQAAGLAITKAGVAGRDMDGAARKVITDAGYGAYFGHSYGHSLGIEIHEAPYANPSNDKPMPAGAVCSAEPGIYLPGRFGVRIEDSVIITEDGYENLAHSPKELIIL